jgi:hypothetical protein
VPFMGSYLQASENRSMIRGQSVLDLRRWVLRTRRLLGLRRSSPSVTEPMHELVCSRGSTRDRVKLPAPRHTLQHVLTSVIELNARANNEVLDGSRDKNLAR